MKNLLLIFIVFFSANLSAQEKNYGLIAGIVMLDSDLSDELSSGASPGYRLGVYYDFQLNSNIGIKPIIAFSKIQDAYFEDPPNIYRSSLDLISLMKYNLNSDYNKGTYILFGPRLSFLISAENNSRKILNFYSNNNFGLLFGFGFSFGSFMKLEITADYGFTDITQSSDYETKTLGGNIHFTFNLSSIFEK